MGKYHNVSFLLALKRSLLNKWRELRRLTNRPWMLKRKSKNTTRQSDNKLEIGDGYMSYVYKNKIKKPKGQKPNS